MGDLTAGLLVARPDPEPYVGDELVILLQVGLIVLLIVHPRRIEL